jgi:hypothetical protein
VRDATPRRRRLLLRSVVGAVLAWPALGLGLMAQPAPADSPAYPVAVGLSDNLPGALADRRFAALGVRLVRLVTPWNAVDTDPTRLDTWIAAAEQRGWEPHVAFEHARGDQCPDRPCALPSAEEFRAAFAAFHRRHPEVTVITPWNEANHTTQPTATAPGHAAAYFDAVSDLCPDCTIVAADVLAGTAGLAPWLQTFRATAQHPPALWGLHDYGDVNRGSTADTDAFLRLVDGPVWLTETGGIVYFETHGHVVFPFDEDRAAVAVNAALDLAAVRSTRITRLYLYNWTAGDTWDSGLARPDGSLRPAYTVLARRLAAPAATLLAPALDAQLTAALPALPPALAGPIAAGSPAPSTRPDQRLHLVFGSRQRTRRAARVQLVCPAGRASACRGTLLLRAVSTTVRATFVVATGRRRWRSVHLAPRMVRALRRRGELRATLTTLGATRRPQRLTLVWPSR